MKTALCCVLLVLATLLIAEGRVTRRQRRSFLQQHNSVRRKETNAADTLKMKWDKKLARSAQAYADQCNFAHSSNKYRQDVSGAPWGWIGENIYLTSLRSPSNIVDKTIESWKAEKAYYSYPRNECQSRKVCGHYLQVRQYVCLCVRVCHLCVFILVYPLDDLGQHIQAWLWCQVLSLYQEQSL